MTLDPSAKAREVRIDPPGLFAFLGTPPGAKGVVLFAHGWQKLVIKGIGGTYAWFQAMGIPLAIVATSFVTTVEFVGGALLLLGALTRVVVALHILVMIGAAA